MTNVIARRAVITGRVQGVGFRAACAAQARALGVQGWVANRNDGAVVAHIQGATPLVEAMLTWCAHGPPAAAVDAVTIEPAETHAPTGFVIRRSLIV